MASDRPLQNSLVSLNLFFLKYFLEIVSPFYKVSSRFALCRDPAGAAGGHDHAVVDLYDLLLIGNEGPWLARHIHLRAFVAGQHEPLPAKDSHDQRSGMYA